MARPSRTLNLPPSFFLHISINTIPFYPRFNSSTVKMERADTTETLVTTSKATWHDIESRWQIIAAVRFSNLLFSLLRYEYRVFGNVGRRLEEYIWCMRGAHAWTATGLRVTITEQCNNYTARSRNTCKHYVA
jgi:hypothetical protein